MKKTTAHAIEGLTQELGLIDLCGKITLVLRSKETAIEERPNAFLLTRGKNGWTRCIQNSYYFMPSHLYGREGYFLHKNDRKGEVLNGNWESGGSYHRIDYREYSDAEIMAMIEEIRTNGVRPLFASTATGCYIVNEK